MKTRVLLILCGAMLGAGARAQNRSALSPDFYTAQFAGSIGYISVGAGYTFFKNKMDVSLHYGFVPKRMGGEFHIATARFVYQPWQWPISKRLTLSPFNTGIFISYHADSDLSTSWPSRYEDGYYWWQTAIRFHLLWEQRLSFALNGGRFSHLQVFTQLNTNELYAISYLLNTGSIKPSEFVKLGMGVRVALR